MSLAYPDGRCALPAAPHRTRTAVRAVGSAPGQAHWPPPQASATSGRWPSVPGVTHLIARAQMGPIRTPGGPPNPRGRVPHQRRSRALVTPPPPVGPCSPAFIPRGPGPLLCPLAPALSRLPLLPVPAPACWCPRLLALCFFFFFSSPPSPFLRVGVGVGGGGGGGGGVLAVLPFAQAGGGPPLASVIPLVPSPSPRCPRHCPWWVREVGARGGGAPSLPFLRRKHVAGTALARGTALVLLLGCEARRVAPAFALSTLRAHPRCPPRWCGGAAARPSLPATPTLGGAEACGGGGGGGLSFSCRSPRVVGTRRGFRPSAGGGGG